MRPAPQGGVELGLAAAANVNAALTFAGGSGDDTLTLGNGVIAQLTAGTQLDGGAGDNDKLVINDDLTPTTPDATLAAKVNATTGFEVLGLGTNVDALDASKLSTFKHFSLEGGNAAVNFSMTEMAKGTVVDVLAAHTGTVSLAGATGAKELTLNIGDTTSTGLANTGTFTIGQTSVTLTSNGTAPNSINVAAANDSEYTVSGAANLTTGVTVADGTGIVFNAKDMEGALTLTMTHTANNVTRDVITGGKGNDSITVGAACAQLDASAGGNDTFVLTAGQATAGKLFSEATGLNTGDKLTFGTARLP